MLTESAVRCDLPTPIELRVGLGLGLAFSLEAMTLHAILLSALLSLLSSAPTHRPPRGAAAQGSRTAELGYMYKCSEERTTGGALVVTRHIRGSRA